jgi:hypothetical protein
MLDAVLVSVKISAPASAETLST